MFKMYHAFLQSKSKRIFSKRIEKLRIDRFHTDAAKRAERNEKLHAARNYLLFKGDAHTIE